MTVSAVISRLHSQHHYRPSLELYLQARTYQNSSASACFFDFKHTDSFSSFSLFLSLRLLSLAHSSMTSSSSIPDPSNIPSATELKEKAVEKTKSSLQSLRAFAAGGVGGICAVVVGHPFDLVKVRLQTAEKGVYSGAIDVVRKTIAREGLARVRLYLPPKTRLSPA